MSTGDKPSNGKTENAKDLLAKILIVGDIATGKTSLINRYAHGSFSQRYKATIGVDFAWKPLEAKNGQTVRLQLWDIAGQERFGHMTRVYYKDALGAIVVYDVTRPNTFEAVSKWKEDINKKVFFPGTEDPIPTILLCNKIDLLEGEERPKSPSELDSFSQEQGFLKWYETSAKNNINISEAVSFLVEKILEKIETSPKPGEMPDESDSPRTPDPTQIRIGSNEMRVESPPKSKCNC
eukprot:TRINITY_DN1147_c0_g4_i1.p1 TRINITY_DN1147_c0_g4~~TRINITY_DN1147_c0_g4_i1.p1  ORF type:complete len:237 (-),score=50.55 TRINITY_DN1147_c0_g4_i1:108-818(-)